MDKIQEEYQQLYASRIITGDDIPTYVRFDIIDSSPLTRRKRNYTSIEETKKWKITRGIRNFGR